MSRHEPGLPGGLVPAPRRSADVLADRIAAALAHRAPGWRLPRRSELARRYNVSIAEIDSAIGDLARRSLIRTRSDGQVYRASPAEYLIPVEGIGGLSTRLDPMGAEITCQVRHVSKRAMPGDVARALGVGQDAAARTVRCVWAAGGEPAAVSTAYMLEAVAGSLADEDLDWLAALLRSTSSKHGAPRARARAVELELSPPLRSAGRSLGLGEGQPAICVTIMFDDTATGALAGLAVVVLKPTHFRVMVEAVRGPAAIGVTEQG